MALPQENRQPLIAHLNLLIAYAHHAGAWVGSTSKSQKALARVQRVSDRTVRRIEARLVEAGLITSSVGLSGNRRKITIMPKVLAADSGETAVETPASKGADTSAAPRLAAVEKAGCGQERRPQLNGSETVAADTSAALVGQERRGSRTPAPPLKGTSKEPSKETIPRKRGGDHQLVVDWWHQTFERERGTRYAFQAKDGYAVKKLLKLAPVDEIKRRGEFMLTEASEWMRQNGDLTTLLSKWNTLTGPVPKRSSRPHIEEYEEDRDAMLAAVKRA